MRRRAFRPGHQHLLRLANKFRYECNLYLEISFIYMKEHNDNQNTQCMTACMKDVFPLRSDLQCGATNALRDLHYFHHFNT